MIVVETSIDELDGSSFASVYLLKPDRRQMVASIKKHGILCPVVVQAETGVVIDGKSRVEVASELGMETVPTVDVDCDDIDAMILHVRLNRSRGDVVAMRLSQIVRRIIISGRYDFDELRKELGMSREELQVLADGTALKRRNIDAHVYSAAWVPVESERSEDFRIERPTGNAEHVTD